MKALDPILDALHEKGHTISIHREFSYYLIECESCKFHFGFSSQYVDELEIDYQALEDGIQICTNAINKMDDCKNIIIKNIIKG